MFESLQSVDDRAKTAVTSKEIRALFLHRQLSSAARDEPAMRPSIGIVSTLGNAQPRYAPWLQKALARAEHSKNTWSVKEAPPKVPNARKNTVKSKPNALKCATIWEASERGNVEELRRLLEGNKANVFARNENDGGKTILHYACFNVQLNIVMYITMYIQATKGLEALRLFVNCIDTAYNRCTPLLETCMTLKGNVNDKLKILKLLVLYGATLEHQDAHGDNALHWSVRNSCLPIVRYLVKETDAAVFAVITDNFKLQKPLDVAKRVMDKKPTLNSVEVYNLLRLVYRECNIRLKIQYGKKIRLHNEAEVKANQKEDTMQALDNARIWTTRTDALWNTCHDTAEVTRNAIESKFVDEAGKEAVGKAQLWLETKDGKAWMKKELPNALDNLKNLVQDGTLPKPRDLKRTAAVRLCEAYISTQESEMREQMRKKFTRENPPLDSREVEYYKRMVTSKTNNT
ncbi:hypothetical protein THRCLA_01360 [Thraustotheca clavata]|uniref:Uncharacterized protein n=1 Tax=Thraustotheca clavata TaxID=74557 RepID=A0A1W0A8V3_9STRA|nr:hypothetical protein THRCLA_01360 [Thraustotheca clavata]